MSNKELATVIEEFLGDQKLSKTTLIVQGLINKTYRVDIGDKRGYILQQVNQKVFTNPNIIQDNILHVSKYLIKKNYPRIILKPIFCRSKNSTLVKESGNIWRMFSFAPNSNSYDKVESSDHAFQAAQSLGEFHLFLSDFDSTQLKNSIPNFLNFQQRIEQFDIAITEGIKERITSCQEEIKKINNHYSILEKFNDISIHLPKQVIHADPKISNFLYLQGSSKVLGLIDWDTLMHGPILYDFGDMVRSFTNKTVEDDISTIEVFNKEYYELIRNGYLIHQNNNITLLEKNNLMLGAQTVTYIQAIRFLSDYLIGDKYFNVNYPEQNKNRAINQLRLLEGLIGYKNRRIL